MASSRIGEFVIGVSGIDSPDEVADFHVQLHEDGVVTDIYHIMGQDLAVSATGGLSLVSGPERGRQRIIRRLLTSPNDYIWEPDYGSGLPVMIGSPANAPAIRGNVRAQMAKEAAVAADPTPNIDVTVTVNGIVTVNILYADAETSEPQQVTVQRGSAP